MIEKKNDRNAMKRRSKMAIVALVVPSILVMSSLALLIVINLIFNPTFWMVPDGEPITPTPIPITVLNGVLLIAGAVGLLSLLPGVIVGILLLARNKRYYKDTQ